MLASHARMYGTKVRQNLKHLGLLTFLLTLTLWAAADNKKVSPDLAKGGDGPINVIVQFTTPPARKECDKVTKHGGKVTHDLSVVNGFKRR